MKVTLICEQLFIMLYYVVVRNADTLNFLKYNIFEYLHNNNNNICNNIEHVINYELFRFGIFCFYLFITEIITNSTGGIEFI